MIRAKRGPICRPATASATRRPSARRPILEDPALGRYYNRTYTLTAFGAGRQNPDQRSTPIHVQLPTISSFTVSPAAIGKVTDTVTVSWSLSGVDPEQGKITLTLAPTDGTGPYTIDIPSSPSSGSGKVTPTPLTATTYSLGVVGGDGSTAPPKSLAVTSSLAPGFVPVGGLGTLPLVQYKMSLAAFSGRLWCALPGPLSALFVSTDGSSWSAVTPDAGPAYPGLPYVDGFVVTVAGSVETLWAFGWDDQGISYVLRSADGIHWAMQPTPPYPTRLGAGYAAHAGRLYVAGGGAGGPDHFKDIWSSPDGRAWK